MRLMHESLPSYSDISTLLRRSTQAMDEAEAVRRLHGELEAGPLYLRARELRLEANAKLRTRLDARVQGIPFDGACLLD